MTQANPATSENTPANGPARPDTGKLDTGKLDTGKVDTGSIVKRSVVIAGHQTSVSLEHAFWQALKQAAARRAMTINDLVTHIDQQRQGNLSSAIRVFLLEESLRGQTAA
jgi:predicted DNA-binding ribbon-helix-helix protein